MSRKPDERERLRRAAALRSTLCAETRRFLADRGYLEVTTPVIVSTPAIEEYIDAIPCDGGWLRTSPELHMKRLLCAGYERIFQIGPCFRKGERGRRHLPEFTMLEWYRTGANAYDLLDETRAWLNALVEAVRRRSAARLPEPAFDTSGDWLILTVEEAFRRFAGRSAREAARTDMFEHILVEHVEPALPRNRPVVLTDYPPEQAGYARIGRGEQPYAERWELYLGGLEAANACTEITDPEEQRRRFEHAALVRRRRNQPVYEFDRKFLEALESGMPPAAGIAVGIERLMMAWLGARSIDSVTFFP